MKDWNMLASNKSIQKAADALRANGVSVIITENAKEAKKKILEILPQNAQVMNMSSVTLEALELPKEIEESDRYKSVKNTLAKMDRKTQGLEMQRLGAAPEYAIGSIHAITEDGKLLIASNTGSQLPAYSYASPHVIWVAGTQKIVKNVDEGLRRIYEYVLPLESERVKKAYGMEKSNVSKLLIINKEIAPNRLYLILVKEKLGF